MKHTKAFFRLTLQYWKCNSCANSFDTLPWYQQLLLHRLVHLSFSRSFYETKGAYFKGHRVYEIGFIANNYWKAIYWRGFSYISFCNFLKTSWGKNCYSNITLLIGFGLCLLCMVAGWIFVLNNMAVLAY